VTIWHVALAATVAIIIASATEPAHPTVAQSIHAKAPAGWSFDAAMRLARVPVSTHIEWRY
jgi:hypothetical protein